MNLFDPKLLKDITEIVRYHPRVKPEKYEAKYQVTQLFETGVEVTIYWVIRDGKQFIYDSKTNYPKA